MTSCERCSKKVKTTRKDEGSILCDECNIKALKEQIKELRKSGRRERAKHIETIDELHRLKIELVRERKHIREIKDGL